ncbi:hypothetical protein SLEP1_g21769 [Rubroshorea leprosula]|uniref:Uncharacterized protein n=1 Tax=Rubroshorea leprosula TaxID=152421 RepID=A0AAV5JGD0_9ROSI|nr:hypothetical protein SLEP1_g21769 [Rubroshorea leprosula]
MAATSFFNFRSTNHEPKVRTSSTHHGSPSCGKLDGVAMWLINGVAAAFFASLERCSCIRIATEEDGDEANDVPLIYNDGNYTRQDAAGATLNRRRTGKPNNKTGGEAFEEV